MIEHAVFFATGHKGKAGQIGEHRPGAVLAIKPQQDVFLWELVCREIATNGRERFPQFLSVSPVASGAPKPPSRLSAVRLRNRRARPDDLPTFAPFVAGGTHLIQPAEGLRQVLGFRQGALTGGFTRAINSKDHPPAARSIYQTPGLLVVRHRTTEQIVQKQRAQDIHRGLRPRR